MRLLKGRAFTTSEELQPRKHSNTKWDKPRFSCIGVLDRSEISFSIDGFISITIYLHRLSFGYVGIADSIAGV